MSERAAQCINYNGVETLWNLSQETLEQNDVKDEQIKKPVQVHYVM
jgi:hypothetical protein